jgi:aminoglycoside phosphotransferase (APT) family kinase protein
MTGCERNVARNKRRARRHTAHHDEPVFDECVEWGGDQLIYVVGRTDAGFAYGPSIAELRRDNERTARGAGWARAKRVLRELLEREAGAVSEIGWVKKIGDGLSRDIFAAEVELADGRCDTYVVALPRRDAAPALDERTSRELRLVARLRQRRFPFRLPEMVGAFPDGDRLALVRQYAKGVELDLRAGRQPSVRPWEIVGEVAAAIHAVSGTDVEDILPGAATRDEHARAALAVIDGLAEIEMRDAYAWALEHLPPAEPSTLLHGDLLGQNILLAVDGPHHVIDWEYARRGDPAYDLAIVTRGIKQPFHIDRGLDRLRDAYRAHGGHDILDDQVHLYELSLIAGWYRAALSGRGAHPPAHELDRMRSLLRRLR